MKRFEGHTPGPWTLKKSSHSIVRGAKVIASVHNHLHKGMTEAETDANADLIAAAPELLAEREKLRDALQDIYDVTHLTAMSAVIEMRGIAIKALQGTSDETV